MKRCPQCLFIYPESDQRCDFDNTPLVVVTDSEIDAATKPRRKHRGFLLIAAAMVLVVPGIFVLYKNKTSPNPSPELPVVTAAAIPDEPTPTPLPSPSASPSPSPSPKPSPARTAASHTSASVNPVSTGVPTTGTKHGSKPIILLTDGGKIEADEVWRTRDGIWYRRNGIVSLLKHSRVRSIVNR